MVTICLLANFLAPRLLSSLDARTASGSNWIAGVSRPNYRLNLISHHPFTGYSDPSWRPDGPAAVFLALPVETDAFGLLIDYHRTNNTDQYFRIILSSCRPAGFTTLAQSY
ncbi:hypothetical protein PILCRDRAFT_469772 [Piloderma croceum F 1598]|uniref:Uncharacterized protein n=1 Tax=Piloderma croceum (strain F 1598) TaxID=765440 RepID=A0A0C3BXS9_PILCF|nr:hypothetical protein PILCRDRAFT_469772 [Piloderma croceum F 1598]